jgi:hypothetical protein
MKLLAPLIAAAKAGETLSLPKDTYQLDVTCNITQAGLTIKGNGSTLIAPAQYEAFVTKAPRVIIDGFVCDQCNVFCRPEADTTTVSNCQLGMSTTYVPGAVHQAIITGPNGTNFTLLLTDVGVTGTVSVYFDRGPVILNSCRLKGSLGEYVVRGDSPDGVSVPTGFLVENCIIGESQAQYNTEGKDTIGFRMFNNVQVVNTTVYRDIRWGEGNQPATTAVDKFTTGEVHSCYFMGAHPALPFMLLDQGATLTVTNSTFDTPQAPSVRAGPQSACTVGGCTNKIPAGGHQWPVFEGLGNAKMTDAGKNATVAK